MKINSKSRKADVIEEINKLDKKFLGSKNQVEVDTAMSRVVLLELYRTLREEAGKSNPSDMEPANGDSITTATTKPSVAKAESKEKNSKPAGRGKSTAVKPVHLAWTIKLKLLEEDPDVARKVFVDACVAEGICKGTAINCWVVDVETITARLKKAGVL